MKSIFKLGLAAVLLALLAAAYFTWPGHAPTGQPTLTELDAKTLSVWEPILPTDWSRPSTSALARVSDSRVRQYWDPNHLLSAVIQKTQESSTLHPDCCNRKGFLWDLTAAYPPTAQWRDTPPQPILFNGPVVRTTSDIDALVAKTK